MKYLYLFLLYTLFALNCGKTSKKSDNISLVFLRTEIPDIAMIKELKEELFVSQFTDSVVLKGEEYPVFVIELNNENLDKYGLTSEDVTKVLEKELDIPRLASKEQSNIAYKQKDFERFYRNKSIDELISLPIKINESDKIIPLSSIAQIRLQLHEDQLFYQNELVYIISFKYLGKNKNELNKMMESIDKYGIKYRILYE